MYVWYISNSKRQHFFFPAIHKKKYSLSYHILYWKLYLWFLLHYIRSAVYSMSRSDTAGVRKLNCLRIMRDSSGSHNKALLTKTNQVFSYIEVFFHLLTLSLCMTVNMAKTFQLLFQSVDTLLYSMTYFVRTETHVLRKRRTLVSIF